jgi:hypothetical protein
MFDYENLAAVQLAVHAQETHSMLAEVAWVPAR